MAQGVSNSAPARVLTVPADYSTIQTAIDHANTGDTVFIQKGTYYCADININKSLKLIGEDATSTIINGQSDNHRLHWGQSTIAIHASDVVLTGFNITNCDVAISLSDRISRVNITGNNIDNNLIGIRDSRITSQSGEVYILGNNITKNADQGIAIYSSNIFVFNNQISENNIGVNLNEGQNIVVGYNQIINNYGNIHLTVISGSSIFGNNITGGVGYNQNLDAYGYGIEFQYNCNDTLIYENNIFGNSYGLNLGNILLESNGFLIPRGLGNIIYKNNFFNNSVNANIEHKYPSDVTGVVNGTILVSWDNGSVGNFWDDYQTKYPNATELTDSGVGSTPYLIDENNTDHYPLFAAMINIVTNEPIPTTSSEQPLEIIVNVTIPVILVVFFLTFIVALIIRRRKV